MSIISPANNAAIQSPAVPPSHTPANAEPTPGAPAKGSLAPQTRQPSDAALNFTRAPAANNTAISANPSSRDVGVPIPFTHKGQQYTVTYDADGGAAVRQGGTTMHFNAEQAADLKGLPTREVLFGAPADAPNAAFMGKPLEQVFAPPPSSPKTPEPLW